MKKATKWISAVGAVGLTAALAVAGVTAGNGHEGREGHEGRGRQMMAAKLNLTDAQKTQWDAIKKASREQNAEFFKKLRFGLQADLYPHPTAKPFLDDGGIPPMAATSRIVPTRPGSTTEWTWRCGRESGWTC